MSTLQWLGEPMNEGGVTEHRFHLTHDTGRFPHGNVPIIPLPNNASEGVQSHQHLHFSTPAQACRYVG